jgi:hypothetical protein
VRFHVLPATSVKMFVFWDVAPCSLVHTELLTSSVIALTMEAASTSETSVDSDRLSVAKWQKTVLSCHLPWRLSWCLQDNDGYLLRVQPAHPEPSGGACLAGRQRLGRSGPRAGGGVNTATTAGSRASGLRGSNNQHQPAHRDAGNIASQLRYGSGRT